MEFDKGSLLPECKPRLNEKRQYISYNLVKFELENKKTAIFLAILQNCITFATDLRKIGRVTECAGLEIRYTLFRVSGV